MNAATEFELLKARRSPVFGAGAAVIMVAVPAIVVMFVQLARARNDSVTATKAAAMMTDISVVGLIQMSGQVLSVATLAVVGIAASWSFGREFVDDAASGLFAIATTRTAIVAAKFVVLIGWAVVAVTGSVGLSVVAGIVLGLPVGSLAEGAPSGGWPDVGWMALRAEVTGVLAAVLAAPMALVSSWRRGYLPGFVTLMSLVVLTQVATAVGSGGWFPYAAPSLWMGMGGAAAAAAVSTVQLVLPLVVGAAAVGMTLVWWRRAELC